VLRAASAVSTTTETLGDALAERYGPHVAEKTTVVPTGVDTERFDVEDERDRQTDPPVIIYTGNIGHAQNLEACVHALDRLSTDAELRLVGGGDLVPELRTLCRELGVSGQVRFVDPVPQSEIPSMLAEATVGLAPLVDDPELAYAMPTKLYEYLGCGLPVVTTGRGELRRFVEAADGGIHTKAEPEALAAAFERLLTDDERRREFGANGRAFVEREYDHQEIAERFSATLRELTGTRTRPSGREKTTGGPDPTALADEKGLPATDKWGDGNE
jgi:colanic acid biosynthesis glycosyl transferase WcaI